jgi:hypothetical protein
MQEKGCQIYQYKMLFWCCQIITRYYGMSQYVTGLYGLCSSQVCYVRGQHVALPHAKASNCDDLTSPDLGSLGVNMAQPY